MASEILRRINSRKLPGTVNFYALNRLNKRQLRSPQVEFVTALFKVFIHLPKAEFIGYLK